MKVLVVVLSLLASATAFTTGFTGAALNTESRAALAKVSMSRNVFKARNPSGKRLNCGNHSCLRARAPTPDSLVI